MKNRVKLKIRPRRNRSSEAIRSLVQETRLSVKDLIYPMFVIEGENTTQTIASMPGIDKLSIDLLVKEAKEVYALGIPAIVLFP